jgi:AAHS family 4-hydroxybenzoate transporter-like MFS transporter
MAERETELDVGELMQNRPLGRFQLTTFALCVLALFVNGLNFSSANVAAPAILRAFDAQASAMSAVFGWGFVGFFVGSIAFGAVGDRFGRKAGIIGSMLAYSLPALLSAFATSIDELAIYRGLAGLGIGGLIPNVVALLNETAPKSYRVTFVMAAFVGYSAGNATMGWIATFIPEFGWQIVFLVAGTAGFVFGAIQLALLPESIPFLAATSPGSKRLRQLITHAAPDLHVAESTRFVLRRPANEMKFALKLLFEGERRIITPLLWLAFFAETLTYITLSTWLPVLLERAGLAPAQASLAYSFGALGAAVAILVVARLIDRFGMTASVFSALVAVAATMSIGIIGSSPLLVTMAAILAMGFGSATHNSLLGIVGGFYPTVVRGNGVGYAASMGRIAGIVGPATTGVLLTDYSLQVVLLSIAAPDLVVAAICIVLAYYAPRIGRAPGVDVRTPRRHRYSP